ncbi:hypothetical protein IAC76_06645 [Spirochaetes bacterium]|uniref:EF-hand domain-containing protein n=1 Tax=Candidatus Scatousia excrementipullorum TaxID=2840936 RepID=A0A9D9DS46_9BACT|nr:hypothetical protein [Candidatus Scatousia excrementipullorum]
MGVSGNNNMQNMYSTQLSKQMQIGLQSFKTQSGAIGDRNAFQAAGREASSIFRQTRAAENTQANMAELAQMAAMMGLNVDLNQLAAMYDTNGDGNINSAEKSKIENALNMMYTQQTQQMAYANMQNSGSTQAAASGGGGGGFNIGDAISTLTSGIGELFGGGSSESGSSEGSSGGNWLSKAGDIIGGLFG